MKNCVIATVIATALLLAAVVNLGVLYYQFHLSAGLLWWIYGVSFIGGLLWVIVTGAVWAVAVAVLLMEPRRRRDDSVLIHRREESLG